MKDQHQQHEEIPGAPLPDLKGAIEDPDPIRFQRRKLAITLGIMGGGMLMALIWNYFQGSILGKGFPHNTFLFLPKARFGDFADTLFTSSLPNPYVAPDIPYLPFTWVSLRPFSLVSCATSLIFCIFISLAGLALLLTRVLEPIIVNPWARVGFSYLLMGLCYPLLFCIDRGNIEMLLALLIAVAIFFIGQRKYMVGMLWLLPAISFKLYPAFLLVLLLRQRKLALAASAGILFLIITFLSLKILSLPSQTTWDLYQRNMTCFADTYVYENYSIEGSASPWNCYKIGLIMAGDLELITPVDFSFDAGFIRTSYAVYSGGMAFLALILVIYTCMVEKEFLRCATVLLLFLAISAPSGGDYRLLYAGMALVLLVLLKTRRSCDWFVLVLVALTMAPKKEFFMAFAGTTETGTADVSIQVLFNPVCVIAAILLLLYDGGRQSDMRWSRLRFFRLRDAILRWTPARGWFPRTSS